MTELQGVSILIVDDEADLRQLFVWEFQDHGVDINVADSVSQAKKILSERKCNVIVSDVKMPDGSGIDLFRFIEENNIILDRRYLMTAYASDDLNLSELKVDNLFKKPLKTREVFDYMIRDLGVK